MREDWSSLVQQMVGQPGPYRGWTNPTHAFSKRQAEIDRAKEAQAQTYNQSGTATFVLDSAHTDTRTGMVTGEVFINVKFAYHFIEPPTFNYGFELASNKSLAFGLFLDATADITAWTTTKASSATLFHAVRVGVLATSVPGLKLALHCSFTGRGFTPQADPFNDSGSV